MTGSRSIENTTVASTAASTANVPAEPFSSENLRVSGTFGPEQLQKELAQQRNRLQEAPSIVPGDKERARIANLARLIAELDARNLA